MYLSHIFILVTNIYVYDFTQNLHEHEGTIGKLLNTDDDIDEVI